MPLNYTSKLQFTNKIELKSRIQIEYCDKTLPNCIDLDIQSNKD